MGHSGKVHSSVSKQKHCADRPTGGGVVCFDLFPPIAVTGPDRNTVYSRSTAGTRLSSSSAGACGSASQPCSSLQAAVDMARPGNVILLAAGIYTGNGEAVLSLTEDKAVTLIGGYDPITWAAGDAATPNDFRR